jgi:hypothetical protein
MQTAANKGKQKRAQLTIVVISGSNGSRLHPGMLIEVSTKKHGRFYAAGCDCS